MASTSWASRGFSAHCVMRMAASWKTMSMPSIARRTRSASRMSPSIDRDLAPSRCAASRFCRRPRVRLSRTTISLEAFGDQPIGDVRSDESSAAGDQRSFVGHALSPLHLAFVFLRPTCRDDERPGVGIRQIS